MCVVFNTPCGAWFLSNSIFSSRSCSSFLRAAVRFAHHSSCALPSSSTGFSFNCFTSDTTSLISTSTAAILSAAHKGNAGKEAVKHIGNKALVFLSKKAPHTLSLTKGLHGGLEGFSCGQARKECEGNEEWGALTNNTEGANQVPPLPTELESSACIHISTHAT